MKKILSLILAVLVLLPGLASCGIAEQPPAGGDGTDARTENAHTGQAGQTAKVPAEGNGTEEAVESAETEWPEPDYSDFELPEETDSLVVYTTVMLGVTLNPAIGLFEKAYPNISVTVKTLGDDEYEALIRTEIPAGRGPDLLFSYGIDIPDIYKAIKSGLFMDLNPFFINDPSFSLENYVEGVLNCGLFEGSRYFVPIEYMCPVLVTSLEALKDAGFTTDDLSTWDSFTDTLIQYKENVPDGDMFLTPGGVQNNSDLLYLFLYSNFNAIDYVHETASVDKDKLEKIVNAAKLYYQEKRTMYLQTMISGALMERKGLYCNELNATTDIYMKIRGLRSYGETPVFFAMPDLNNGVTAQVCSISAIPQGAKNKLNAYRLLTLLLSEELQGGESPTGSNLRIGLPVNKNALRGKLYGMNQKYSDVDGEIITEKDAEVLFNILTSPTRSIIIPPIIKRYLNLEIMPYIYGEKGWEDCYKRFLNTLELYASE